MKIRKKNITINLIIMALLVINYHFFYLFKLPSIIDQYLGGSNKFWVVGFILIGITAYYVFIKKDAISRQFGRYLIRFLVIVIISTFILIVYTQITYSNQSMNDTLRKGGVYFWLLGSYFFLMFMNSYKSEKKIFLLLNRISLVWYVILLLQYLVFKNSGAIILDIGSYFSSDSIITRNDTIRISLNAFGNYLIVYNYWLILNRTAKNKAKLLNYVNFAIGLFELLFIQQTRIYTMVVFLCIAIITLLSSNSYSKLFRTITLCTFAILYCVSTGVLDTFLSSFSINGDLGGNTQYRLDAIAYYGALFLQKPLLGIGFVAENGYYELIHSATGKAFLDDVGIVGQLAQTGLCTIVFFIIPLIRMIYIVNFLRRKKILKNHLMLPLSVLYLLATATSLIVTNSSRILLLAFLIAYFEFTYRNARDEIKVW